MSDPRYFPILKWKKAEVLAVRHLAPADRAQLLPIAEIQPHHRGLRLESFLPGDGRPRAFGIDLRLTASAGKISSVLDLCRRLGDNGGLGYPVIQAELALADPEGLPGLREAEAAILRFNPFRTQPETLTAAVDALEKYVRRRAPLFAVVDVEAIGDTAPEVLVAVAERSVRQLLGRPRWAAVAFAGGSFPFTLAGMPQGIQNRLPRQEWRAWIALREREGCQAVRFGDYAVTNPVPLEIEDPTRMNPSAAIRYAQIDHWWVLRAAGVRQGGFGQYNQLCRLLIRDPRYSGADFSYGDGNYNFHARGEKPGNLMSWRRDATSHHLVQTVRQLGGE